MGGIRVDHERTNEFGVVSSPSPSQWPTEFISMSGMTEKCERRWFRFSLRTMFVLVTLLGVWLGWQMKIVRDRQAVWKSIKTRGGRVSTQASIILPLPAQPEPSIPELSHIRQLLGDKNVVEISLSDDHSDDEMSKVQAAFPEARVWRYNDVFGKSISRWRYITDKP